MKAGVDEPVCRAAGDTDIENRRMDMAGRGGGGGWDVWREEHRNIHYHM